MNNVELEILGEDRASPDFQLKIERDNETLKATFDRMITEHPGKIDKTGLIDGKYHITRESDQRQLDNLEMVLGFSDGLKPSVVKRLVNKVLNPAEFEKIETDSEVVKNE